MCKSVQTIVLGCLAFSLTYIGAGCIQVTVGIIFMMSLPIFRLASNIWTGGSNIVIGSILTGLICYGKTTLTKHKICLCLSLGVVIINLGNLLILEILEWRVFLPPTQIQEIVQQKKTDLLLAAYLSSTISTAIALVVGFVACEYIYCLLIASVNNEEEENKTHTKEKGFPRRYRRASWFEPISFSWVFEAADDFYNSSLYRNATGLGRNRIGVQNKPIQNCVEVDNKTKPQILTHHNMHISPDMKHSSSSQSRSLSTGMQAHGRGGAAAAATAVAGGDSKSSSGYSSPDWMTIQNQNSSAVKHNSDHHRKGATTANSEQLPESTTANCNISASSKKSSYLRDSGLPIDHCVPSTSSSQNYRKRSISIEDDSHPYSKSGQSPQKRLKQSHSKSSFSETKVVKGKTRQPLAFSELSIAPNSFAFKDFIHPFDEILQNPHIIKQQAELIEIHNLSHLSVPNLLQFPYPQEHQLSPIDQDQRSENSDDSIIDVTHSWFGVPSTSLSIPKNINHQYDYLEMHNKENLEPWEEENIVFSPYSLNETSFTNFESDQFVASVGTNLPQFNTDSNGDGSAFAFSPESESAELSYCQVQLMEGNFHIEEKEEVRQEESVETKEESSSDLEKTLCEEKELSDSSCSLSSIDSLEVNALETRILKYSVQKEHSNSVTEEQLQDTSDETAVPIATPPPEQTAICTIVPNEIQQHSVRHSWTLSRKKLYFDGIVFHSLDRHKPHLPLNSVFADHGIQERNCKSDSVIHWSSCSNPQIQPIIPDDSDSLINLSNLELLARHWRTQSSRQLLQNRLSAEILSEVSPDSEPHP